MNTLPITWMTKTLRPPAAAKVPAPRPGVPFG